MEKLHFDEFEVIAYLESKYLDETANDDEIELYESYIWSGKLDKFNHTYKGLVFQMRRLFEIK